MKFNKLYQKLQESAALEVLDDETVLSSLENEFATELTHLLNMGDFFKTYDQENQRAILKVYDVLYRVGMPLIEDAEYDKYENQFNSTFGSETPDVIMFEPTVAAWKKAEHNIPMGSLGKCTSVEEIEKWNAKDKIAGKEKLISEKLDGISLSLQYERGRFKRAITRGDGKEGDDITENAYYFDGVVKELGECMDCTVRGELIITKENFETINSILVSSGKDRLKNTRNGVAGLATKFKDRNEEILGLITFMAYEIQVFKIHETGENVV